MFLKPFDFIFDQLITRKLERITFGNHLKQLIGPWGSSTRRPEAGAHVEAALTSAEAVGLRRPTPAEDFEDRRLQRKTGLNWF